MSTSFAQNAASFRDHVPDVSIERFERAKRQDCYSYAQFFHDHQAPPWLHNLVVNELKPLLHEPIKGVTTDGTVISGLYQKQDEEVPIEKIVEAAKAMLEKCTPQQREEVQFPMNSAKWRSWSNPEILLSPFGLRLEELSEELRISILDLLKATVSAQGYEKARSAMRINGFLGDVCGIPTIMNEYSYNFLLFGEPSVEESRPWGFSLYGHHLSVSVTLRGPQIIVAPTFTGAEPNLIDVGPFKGTRILEPEDSLGLRLQRSLPDDLQKKSQIFTQMHDPAMPAGRWNKDDQRHLLGMFRDNRVVPYEGICVSSFSAEQKEVLAELLDQFLLYMPEKARTKKIEQCSKFWDETWWCWIGGWGDSDAFYYRVQSPVVACEFDHHSGVFLTNEEPMRFHTHTIVRWPNGGDYGNALREPEMKVGYVQDDAKL